MMSIAALWLEKKNNVGPLARTCEALNAQFVVSHSRRAEAHHGNTPKYPFVTINARDIDPWVKGTILRHRVVSIECGGKPLGEFAPDPNVVLLLGSEKLGIPEWILDKTEIATIPQQGLSPCLNVSVAGSIAAYHFSGVLTHGN